MPSSSAFSNSSVAATPASIFIARSISSAAVRRETLPISFKYIRTGSPVKRATDESPACLRLRERLDFDLLFTFGGAISTVALSSSSGIPSRRLSSVKSLSLTSESSCTSCNEGSVLDSRMSSVSSSSISAKSAALASSAFFLEDAALLAFAVSFFAVVFFAGAFFVEDDAVVFFAVAFSAGVFFVLLSVSSFVSVGLDTEP